MTVGQELILMLRYSCEQKRQMILLASSFTVFPGIFLSTLPVFSLPYLFKLFIFADHLLLYFPSMWKHNTHWNCSLMDLNIYLFHKDETSTVYSPCYTSALFISRAQTLLECGCSAPHRFWAVPVLSPVAFFELVEHKEDVGSLNSAVVSLWPLIRPCFSLYFLYSLHGRILPLFL